MGEALVKDWQNAGLAKASVFKPLIATIEKARVIKVMGQLSDQDQQGLETIIQTILRA